MGSSSTADAAAKAGAARAGFGLCPKSLSGSLWRRLGPVTAPARPRPGGTDRAGAGADSAGTDPDGAELGPGDLRVSATAVLVGTGTTAVRLGDVQPEGKRRMPAADWARGIGHSGLLVLD